MNQTSRSAAILSIISKSQNETSNQHPIKTVHPSLAVAIGVLSILFSVTFLILAYAKFCLTAYYGEETNDEEIPPETLQSVSRFSGIDRKVVESLPFFNFSTLKGHKEGLECAVCLSKFQGTETLRLMPRCKHAFHINCIDKWLESHSSCPICRDRFDPDDLINIPITNSLRYSPSSFHQLDDQNVQYFVERQEDGVHHRRSSRFNIIVGSLRRLALGWKEEQSLQKDIGGGGDILHKFNHRIIVSDLICKGRWSDLNSSDLTFLNSEMLNYASSKRFSHGKSQSFDGEFKMNEDIIKIKEDMERKRLYESRISKVTNNSGISESFPSVGINIDQDHTPSSNLLNPAEKRAMSEIVYVPRLANSNARTRNMDPLSRNERIRKLWLPIARRTVQWFNGTESALQFKKTLQENWVLVANIFVAKRPKLVTKGTSDKNFVAARLPLKPCR